MSTIITLTSPLVSSLTGATGKKGPAKPKKNAKPKKKGWLKNRKRKEPANHAETGARAAEASSSLKKIEAGKTHAFGDAPPVAVRITDKGLVFQKQADGKKSGEPFVSQALEHYPKALEMHLRAAMMPAAEVWDHYHGPVAKGDGRTLDDVKDAAHERISMALASTINAKKLILEGKFEQALKNFEGVTDDLAPFQPKLRYQAVLLMQLKSELRRAMSELSLSQMAKVKNIVEAHRLVIESFFMAMEEYAERSYLSPVAHEKFERSLQAMVVWTGHARVYLKNELMNLAGDTDGGRQQVGRLVRRVLEFQYGDIDYADPAVINTNDRTRNIVVGDLFGFFGPVFEYNYDAFLNWTMAGSQSMRELAWTLSFRMLFWNSAEDLDVVSDECPTDAALLQRVQGVLTRAYGMNAAQRATERINGMLEEAEDMAREVAQRAERVDRQRQYGEHVAKLYAWADELRASRLVVAGHDAEATPDTTQADLLYDALKDRLPPDFGERAILARLEGVEARHRTLADTLHSAREAVARVLRPVDGDDRGLLAKSAVGNLVRARRKKKGIASSMERRKLREDLEAAQRFVEQLGLDVEMAPQGLVAERIRRRATVVLPSLAEALLFFPSYRSDEIKRVFSRADDGTTESERLFPPNMLPGNGMLPRRAEVMRFLRQRGICDTPVAYKVWNYWLSKAPYRNDEEGGTTRSEFGAHDLPAIIAVSPGLTALTIMRRAVGFAAGEDVGDVAREHITRNVLYDAVRCGIAMGLDPVEAWELGYAMTIAHMDAGRSSFATGIDRLIDRMRFEDDFTIYPQLASMAGRRKDGLQRAIFLAREGQSLEVVGQETDAAKAYDAAARLLESVYIPAPDIHALLVERIGQLQSTLTFSAGNVLSTVGSGMITRR